MRCSKSKKKKKIFVDPMGGLLFLSHDSPTIVTVMNKKCLTYTLDILLAIDVAGLNSLPLPPLVQFLNSLINTLIQTISLK